MIFLVRISYVTKCIMNIIMDRRAKNQYIEIIRERYLKAGKKEKGEILDE